MTRAPTQIALKLLAFAGVIFFATTAARAQGTTAAQFLELGFGARALGQGEAFTSVANDPSALYYNPAGLAYPASDAIKTGSGPYEFLAAHTLLIQDVQLSQVGIVRRPYGLSLSYLSLSGIESRTLETDAPGNVGASDMSFGASAADKFFGIGFGASAKFIHETLAGYSASAFAVDFGALKRFDDHPVSLGLDITNVGSGIRFIDQTYPLPLTTRFGVTYGLTHSFPHALTLQIDVPRDSGPILRLGGEYLGFGPIALRAGYRTVSSDQRTATLGKTLGTTVSGLGDFYGMYLGTGLHTPFGNFDYALVPFGELGTSHWFTFALNFGRAQR